tara:strand:+ start:89 stop:658 length:570 start_codon:yes stop_codon:yes gene_type:complete
LSGITTLMALEAVLFIAHLPSGYILGTAILKRCAKLPATGPAIIAACMLGAIAPDFDMAYFYLVDHRQTPHHKYLSHWPSVWFTLLLLAALWFHRARSRAGCLALVFCAGAVMHLLLDSFVGDIWWFAPFVDQPYALFTVPARFSPWWLSFVLHWSFAVELAMCVWALLIYRRRRASPVPRVPKPELGR